MTDANQVDASRELVLDGNAVAGLLQTVYGEEMTTCPAECASWPGRNAALPRMRTGHDPNRRDAERHLRRLARRGAHLALIALISPRER